MTRKDSHWDVSFEVLGDRVAEVGVGWSVLIDGSVYVQIEREDRNETEPCEEKTARWWMPSTQR